MRKIVLASRQEGPGRNYLIQHSAGSGKTNSISWLSHRLASLHSEDDQPFQGDSFAGFRPEIRRAVDT